MIFFSSKNWLPITIISTLVVSVSIFLLAISMPKSFDNEIVLPVNGHKIPTGHLINAVGQNGVFRHIGYYEGSCIKPKLVNAEVKGTWGDSAPSFCAEDRDDGRHVYFDDDEKNDFTRETFLEYIQNGVDAVMVKVEKDLNRTNSWKTK